MTHTGAQSRRKPFSIQASLCLAIAITVASTVLAAAALLAYQVHRGVAQAEQAQVLAIAATYAAQVGPLLQRGPAADVARFVRDVPCPQDLRLMAVLDAEGQPVASRGDENLLKRYLARTGRGPRNRQATAYRVPDPLEPVRGELNLAAAPVVAFGASRPAGTLVCAMRRPDLPVLTARQMWLFFAGLCATAVTGFCLGSIYLHHSVVEPLTLLSRRSRLAAAPRAAEPLPGHVPDEINDLATALQDLQMSLDEWRQRTDRLQRDFAVRVQTETARITRELRQTERQAWTDPLTRLGNRRLLDDKLAEIFEAQRRSGQDLALVMFDLDHFKTLNDTRGHQAGDDLLKFAGELLQQCVRADDLAIRYGGDEFLLILPGASGAQGRSIADRAVRLFAQQARLHKIAPPPTMSAGVASMHDHNPPSPEALLRMSDRALYAAKKAGRSHVVVYHASLTQPAPA